MNILILGSEGQIGKPLVKYLVDKEHTVRGWDKINSYTQDLALYENLERLHEDVIWADKVIFLAFEVGGSKYLANADKSYNYIQENVCIMNNVFWALQNTKTPFLFSSSQMSNMHHTNYGFLKDLGERYCRAIGDSAWICRFWNIFGVETCAEEKTHVITDFIKKAREGEIKMISKGEESRQFLHVDDCCKAIETWVDDKWDDNSEFYDITSFEWTTIADVANLIGSLESNVKIIKGDKDDTVQLSIKNPPSEYIKQFWTPQLTLKEGIELVKAKI